MNSNLILKSDVLDIIFEKRNKAYGAYVLRKFYQNRLKRALAIMILASGAFLSFTLIPKRSAQLVIGGIYEIPKTELAKADQTKPKELPKKQDPPKTEIKKPTEPTPVNQKMFIDHIAIVDKKDKSDSIPDLKDTDLIGSTTLITSTPGIPKVPFAPGDPGPAAPKPLPIDRTSPWSADAVDVPPSFPGGTEALMNFLRRHLNNPDQMTDGESVSVKVTFVVGYEGKLKSFKITQDGGDIFNKEVIRVLKKMPDWVPGKAKGENVSVYYTIPVKFTGAD